MKQPEVVIAILGILILALTFACDEDPAGPGDETQTIVFPHADGAEWEYIIGNQGKAVNEFKVVLNGYTDHSTWGNVQNLETWIYDEVNSEWDFFDSFYMKVAEMEVRYYGRLGGDSEELFLKLSMEVGDTWVYNVEDGWSATVLRREDITVPAGTFENCYVVKYEAFYGGEDLSETVWYYSGVGGLYGVFKTGGFADDYSLTGYTIPTN